LRPVERKTNNLSAKNQILTLISQIILN
jgi:hypothetical protein